MKIVIWGVGTRGKRIFSRLNPGEVVAFIDSDENKVGSDYMGTAIISWEQYVEKYSKYFILISLLRPENVIQWLNERGFHNYFDSLNCPAEIWGPRGYADLDKFLLSLNRGKKYGIFGTNFWAIYCCDRMRIKGMENIFLIPEVETEPNRRELIEKSFDFVKFVSTDDNKRDIEHIFIATGITKDVQALREKVAINMENLFDLSRKILDYRNLEIAQFNNIHSGERCFIVATGPSLTMRDLDILYLNGEVSIGMNRVFLAFEHTKWRPDYYMVSDWRCIRENETEIRELPVKNIFVSDAYMDFWKADTPKEIYKYHCHSVAINGNTPFSDDLVYGIYGGGTITYGCIQLAAYLGFKEIYLLGVDFDFSANYKDGSNHFISTYYNENSEPGLFLKQESLDAYESAKEYADAHGIKIYNATRGGKLEVFERVDFDTLFHKK